MSPAWGSFEWREPIVWAKCSHCQTENTDGTFANTDPDGHLIIPQHHSCGIYATITTTEMFNYMNDELAVCLLVEALGSYENSWMHETGFTASGVQVVGLVSITKFRQSLVRDRGDKLEMFLNPQDYYMGKALEIFKLTQEQIFPIEIAMEMMRLQWLKFDDYWPLERS